jgi:hypothetical protein
VKRRQWCLFAGSVAESAAEVAGWWRDVFPAT